MLRIYIVLTCTMPFLLVACLPSTTKSKDNGKLFLIETADETVYQQLVIPFEQDLKQLGVKVESHTTFRYNGSDPKAFIQTINDFYRQNPNFCPLKEAFYAAPNGLIFMTLASDNSTNVRGFLYDHSNKPRLTYAYFKGVSSNILPAIVCDTYKES